MLNNEIDSAEPDNEEGRAEAAPGSQDNAAQDASGEDITGQDAVDQDEIGLAAAEEGDAGADDADADDAAALNSAKVKMVLEAALLSSSEPLSVPNLRRMFRDEASSDTIRALLESLREDWKDRGIELVNIASGWRFQTRADFRTYLDRITPEKAPKYSRAVMETLAIIAYRQPVTRGDIENIRGVTVSAGIIRALEARSWIDTVGYRDVPGRPALYATTKTFLDDLGLRSLQELPPLEEIATTLELSQTQAPPEPVAQTDEEELGESSEPGEPAAEPDPV